MADIDSRVNELKKEPNLKTIIQTLRDEGYTAKQVYEGLSRAGFDNVEISSTNPPSILIHVEESMVFAS